MENRGYPEWINNVVLNALPSFSNLKDLSLSGLGQAFMSGTGLTGFDQLGNLQKLRLSGLDCVRDKLSDVSLNISKAVSRSPQLTTLDLSAPGADFSPIWNILRTENIHITDFTTSSVTHEMFRYFSSYSRLKRLRTLVYLSCIASEEGKWGFNPSNSGVLSHMPRLETLNTSVKMADLRQNGETVELLLDAIPNLPSLASIYFSPSRIRVSRTVHSSAFDAHYTEYSQRIQKIMRAYRSAVPLHLVVSQGRGGSNRNTNPMRKVSGGVMRRFLSPIRG
ncbi:hypothetical protein MVEN_00909000 [Mycena venus]|uniref:Uncharacterized protein n=1 Tax=Mycena venus TaxID=2733690 RepID=A0A8H6Y9R3_9AGAR|nr:hypothetical protein MVEN_00909000 [Mycena venus]